jgi:hypothetical protein
MAYVHERSRFWLPVVLAILSSVLAAPVRAGSLVELLEPPVSKKDLETITRLVEMNAEQRAATDKLFEGYMAAYKPEADRLRQMNERLTEAAQKKADDTDALREAFIAAIGAFAKKKDAAQRQLLSGIKLVLNKNQQAEQWPGVERFMRRNLLTRVYPRAATQWHLVDVVSCAGGAELSAAERDQITAPLRDYELDLDKPLLRFEQAYWTRAGAPIDLKDEELTRIQEEAGSQVAAINKRYTQWVASVLPQEASQRFLTITRLKAYTAFGIPFHREKAEQETRRRIEALDGLTADQREAIRAAYQTWATDLQEFNRWIIAEYDQADAEAAAMTEKAWSDVLARSEESPGDRVWTRTRTRCDGLAGKLEERLRAVLNENQRRAIWQQVTEKK